VSERLSREETAVREVTFVLFAKSDYDVYREALARQSGRRVE
jgi:hypothetical protein